MSQYAKSIVGSVAAVLIAGITTWQAATSDGWRWVDLFPIVIATLGAALTYVVPNVPELPTAKAWVAGSLAALTAVSTAVTSLSPKADAVQIVFAIAGAFLSWYVPNEPGYADDPTHPFIEHDEPGAHAAPEMDPDDPHGDGLDVTQALAQLDRQDAATSNSQMGEAAAPLPIEAEAQQAVAAQTAAIPASVAGIQPTA